MLIVFSSIFGLNKLISDMEDCDDEDYLVGGEGWCYDWNPPYNSCHIIFEVWHYTAELEEEKEIYVHFRRTHEENWTTRMMGFVQEEGLCSRYYYLLWRGTLQEESETCYVYFTCEHNGNAGRDPNSGYHTLLIYDDCTCEWNP